MEKIIIKQLPNRDNPALGSKHIGSKEYLSPNTGRDGKIITGIDENAYDLLSLPEDGPEQKKSKKQKIDQVKAERLDLEKKLGQDLTPESKFWDEFYVILGDDELNLDPLNPRDKLHERFLVANGYVAPSLDAIESDERYLNCFYYIHREKEEETRLVTREKRLDKARSKLFDLSENNPSKLKIVGSYIFGFDPESDISAEKIYLKFKDSFAASDSKERDRNIRMFLDVVEKSSDEIQLKFLLDKAIRKRVVTVRGTVIRRGDQVFGNSYEDALAYLASPERSTEVISLRQELSEL